MKCENAYPVTEVLHDVSTPVKLPKKCIVNENALNGMSLVCRYLKNYWVAAKPVVALSLVVQTFQTD